LNNGVIKGGFFMKKVIATKAAPQAIGPYSQGIQAGGLLFVSGQIPLVPATGEMVAGGIEAQTTQVLDNLQAILTEAGASMDAAVKTTVYLKDIGDFAVVNAIYAKYFTKDCPARVCVEVSNLPKGALIEIDVIAAAN
jgi:2-iminobutanoate/2-iminopropanoate deaminase